MGHCAHLSPMDGPTTHLRLDAEATGVAETLQKTDLLPELKSRSISYIVHELLRRSPEYKTVLAQRESERHPRPGKR